MTNAQSNLFLEVEKLEGVVLHGLGDIVLLRMWCCSGVELVIA